MLLLRLLLTIFVDSVAKMYLFLSLCRCALFSRLPFERTAEAANNIDDFASSSSSPSIALPPSG